MVTLSVACHTACQAAQFNLYIQIVQAVAPSDGTVTGSRCCHDKSHWPWEVLPSSLWGTAACTAPYNMPHTSCRPLLSRPSSYIIVV